MKYKNTRIDVTTNELDENQANVLNNVNEVVENVQ